MSVQRQLPVLAALAGARAWAVAITVVIASGLPTLPAVVAALFGLVIVWADARTVARRLDPLERYLARRDVDSAPSAVPPPSDAAVRDAMHAPRRLAVVAFVVWWSVALVAGVAGVLAGATGPGVAVAMLGAVAAAVASMSLADAARRAIGTALLERLPAGEITPPAARRLARRDGVWAGVITAACVLAGAGMLALRGHPLLAAAAGVPLTLLAGAVGYWRGGRAGRTEAGAIEATIARTVALGEGREPDAPRGDVVPGALGTLATALDALEGQLATLHSDEAAAARTDEAARHMKTQFLAAMSHDLRSPLNSILGFSELLASGADGPLTAAQLESVQAIRASGGELLRLLTDIVDSARLEAGKLVVVPAWTPSVEILTEAVTQGRELVGEGDLRIEAELQPGLPPVYVDRQRIVQAVVGLLGHAAQAKGRGVIRLAARVASGPPGPARQVRVTVHDESRGLSDAQRARIFEAFRAIGEPGGRRMGGLGLNLSLARALVRMSGGELDVDSAPGTGTTFTVALPVDAPSEASKDRRSLLR